MDQAATGNPDTDVAAAATRLSPAEVESLYAEFASDLLAFLQGVLRDPDLAREALQNTFRRVLEAGHTARVESRKGWLFKVSFHEAMALRRRGSQYERALRKYGEGGAAEPAATDDGSGPAVELVREEDVQRLRAALLHLPEDQREVVERRIHRDQTFAAIAADLGVPLGTVLTRMRLALQKLEKRLRSRDEAGR